MLSLILFMSTVSFIIMGCDKHQEIMIGSSVINYPLLLITLFFGAPGTLTAMILFENKIKSSTYYVIVLLGLILDVWCLKNLWSSKIKENNDFGEKF